MKSCGTCQWCQTKKLDDRVQANVIQGSRQDALKYAVSANINNGLRRTNDDKRQAVKILLRDENLGKYQQFPLCLKNPVRPMSAGVAKGNLTPQLSILKPHVPSEKGHSWHPADSGLCSDLLPP